MIDRLATDKRRHAAGDGGFTLIELLVVIVILGILAGVTVFAVGGIDDRGQESACEIDTRTIRTAEEAFFANNPEPAGYSTEAGLVPGFLSKQSSLHNIDGAGLPDSFEITVQGSKCGNDGAIVGTCGPAPGNPDTTGCTFGNEDPALRLNV